MQFKPILFLTVLCLIGIIYIFFIDNTNLGTEKKIQLKNNIIQINSSEIKKIVINDIEIVKNNKEWEITEPVKSDVDREYFGNFYSRIMGLKKNVQYKIKSDTELKKYDIKFDSKLIILTSGNQKIELYPGKKTFNKKYFIYKLPQKTFYMTESNIKNIFNVNLYKLRNKQIYDFISADITGIKIDKDTQSLNFVKVHKNEYDYDWYLEEPEKIKKDWLKLNEMLDELLYIKPDKFDDNPETVKSEKKILNVKLKKNKWFFNLEIFETDKNGFFYCKDNINKFGFYINKIKIKKILSLFKKNI